MTAYRTLIRQAVADALTGLPVTASAVKVGRPLPVAESGLPVLFVYSQSETIEADAIDPDGLPIEVESQRTYGVRVAAVVADPDGEDRLDTALADIEAALAQDETLGGLVDAAYPSGITWAHDGETGTVVVAAEMALTVIYRTDAGAGPAD